MDYGKVKEFRTVWEKLGFRTVYAFFENFHMLVPIDKHEQETYGEPIFSPHAFEAISTLLTRATSEANAKSSHNDPFLNRLRETLHLAAAREWSAEELLQRVEFSRLGTEAMHRTCNEIADLVGADKRYEDGEELISKVKAKVVERDSLIMALHDICEELLHKPDTDQARGIAIRLLDKFFRNDPVLATAAGTEK